MFTLLRGLWDYLFRKEEYYIVILGLDNAGKTVRQRIYIIVQKSVESDNCLAGGSQTLLEKTKNLFIRSYNGIPMDKITTTVGLNGTCNARDAP